MDGIPCFDKSIADKLTAPFPPEQIKADIKRQTDGFEPTYIEAHNVIKRLNDAFGVGGWSHDIIGEPMYFPPMTVGPPQQVIARVKITVRYMVADIQCEATHEQFGSCFLKTGRQGAFIDHGSDLKAAVTDAIKKCATYFGVALELYAKDEAPMQGLYRKDAGGQVQGSFPAMQNNPNAPGEQWQVDEVKKMFAKLGVGDPQWWQTLGAPNAMAFTQGQLQSLIAGQHDWVRQLMAAQGKTAGLQASAA
jgi:hypothetical protein